MDQPIRAIFVTRDRHMPPVTGNFVSPKKHIFFRRYILCFFQSTENYSAASPPYGKYQQKEGQDSMGCGGCPYLVIKTTPPPKNMASIICDLSEKNPSLESQILYWFVWYSREKIQFLLVRKARVFAKQVRNKEHFSNSFVA